MISIIKLMLERMFTRAFFEIHFQNQKPDDIQTHHVIAWSSMSVYCLVFMYKLVLEQAHFSSFSSFIELQNFKSEHIASSCFFHF